MHIRSHSVHQKSYLHINLILFPAIRIGFTSEVYQYNEPDFLMYITNVTIVKEDNRVSEQTFGVGITVSNPLMLSPATLETADNINFDYTLGSPGDTFIVSQFLPNQQSIGFYFFLNSDELPEGTEAFQASLISVEGFPTFQPPISTAYASTEVQIIDNDCKFKLYNTGAVASIIYLR